MSGHRARCNCTQPSIAAGHRPPFGLPKLRLPSVGWGVARFGWTFAPGEKVMQMENDYEREVYNCDIGSIADVDPVPAYAAAIHKSQGSEYPAVVIPVLTQHYTMLQRNLLYTGVTRDKRLVVLVGQGKAVAIAVRNVSGRQRWSKLNEWLTARRW
jgi:exodeoxyribonuclease V alpha subunit